MLLVTSDVVLDALESVIDLFNVKQTRRNCFQVTVATQQAKERVMVNGVKISDRYFAVSSVESNNVAITIKMPFEMVDRHVTDVLNRYG